MIILGEKVIFFFTNIEYNENELDSVNGLCEITLHNNLFDDRCVRDLC